VYLATLSPPYVPGSLFATHGDLRLDTATFNEFIGVNAQGLTGNGLLGALTATGVPLTNAIAEQSELAYLGALVGTMGYTGLTCNAGAGVNDPCFLSVCSDATNCFPAKGFAQLVNAGTTSWANGLDPTATTQNVQIPVGGSVNWRFGPVHNIRQIDSDGGDVYTTNGFGAPGAGSTSKFTYTHAFDAAGTFFFRCEFHPAMHGFVAVGSGVAGLTASLSVLAAAIVAAKALML
jgi:plastocyanin